MIRILIAGIAGVLCLHAAPALPVPAALVTSSMLAFACARASQVLSAAIFGYLLAAVTAAGFLAERWPSERHGETVMVEGTVVSLVVRNQGRGHRFVFESDAGQSMPRRIRVGWYLEDPPPDAGERWRLALRMRAPRGLLNPVGFDHERWSAARRLGALATVRSHPPPRRLAPAANGIAALRGAVDVRLGELMDAHPRAPIIRGLVLGERGGLDRAAWEVFARTGTAHLMAISGLHVGIVASCMFLLVRMIAGGRGWVRTMSVVAGLGGAAAYAILAGWSVPTQRALIMLAVGALVLSARRQVMPLAALTVAAFVVVALDPLSPLTIGYWLSFGAVAAIGWALAFRRAPGAGWALVQVQWAVSLGLLPATMWFFQRGSLVSPLVNLVAVPVFSVLVVPGVMLCALLAMIPGSAGAGLLLRVMLSMLDGIWFLLETVASWPWSQRFTPQPPAWCVVVGTLAAVVALAPGPRPLRWVLALALVAPLLSWRPSLPPEGEWRMTLLDVGQGLAAVVQTRTHTLVFDTGPSWGPDADAGSRTVAPYLRAVGVRRPDLMILSHPHDDHVGGAPSLVQAFGSLPVRAGASDEHPACRAGQAWTWDAVRFRVLHPVAGSSMDPNLASCVLEVRGAGASLLLTGDIEWPAELELTRQPSPLRRVDVVVVPHHGSATSSTVRLVRATRPQHALIPAGFANRWGFPDYGVLSRWQDAGAEVWVVGDAGGITVVGPATGAVTVAAARPLRRAWWRVP